MLARGLTLAGWVGNATAPDMPLLGENVATLRQRLSLLGAPCLGVVPYLNDLNPAAVVNHLDDGALHLVFEPVSTTRWRERVYTRDRATSFLAKCA